MPDLDSLLEHFRQGDRLALSRLLSLAARGAETPRIVAAVQGSPPPKVIAITGGAGVGKSTLIGKLIERLREHNQKVAVLACDPQSSLSGGALLGDRFRMPNRADDDGVFIRSLAALSGHGAVADNLSLLARLLGAFGFDLVLIETVGAGQGDVTVSELADIVVLLLQPETGDDLQWEKAGVLEIADVIVVHKADLPRAEQVTAQIRAALEVADKKPIPVVPVSSRTGHGMAELWQNIQSVDSKRHDNQDATRELLQLAQVELARRVQLARAEGNVQLTKLARQWEEGEISPAEAGSALLRLLQLEENAST